MALRQNKRPESGMSWWIIAALIAILGAMMWLGPVDYAAAAPDMAFQIFQFRQARGEPMMAERPGSVVVSPSPTQCLPVGVPALETLTLKEERPQAAPTVGGGMSSVLFRLYETPEKRQIYTWWTGVGMRLLAQVDPDPDDPRAMPWHDTGVLTQEQYGMTVNSQPTQTCTWTQQRGGE